jgi:ribosomal protein L40E
MEEQQAVCPSCGHFNRTSARFCGKCGYDMHKAVQPTAASGTVPPIAAAQPPDRSQPVSSSAASTASVKEFCPACGKEVTPGARFCRSCGQDLSGAPVETVSAPSRPVASSAPSKPAAAAPPVTSAVEPVGSLTPFAQQPPIAAVDEQTGAGDVRKGIPGWLWLAIGVLVGIMLGAGSVLALPGIAGLERHEATPAITETPPAVATTIPTDTTSQPPSTPAVVEPAQEAAEPPPTVASVEPDAQEPDPNAAALPTPTAPSIESQPTEAPADPGAPQPEGSLQPDVADTVLAPEQDAGATPAP